MKRAGYKKSRRRQVNSPESVRKNQTLQELLARALHLESTGRLHQAGLICKRIFKTDPDNPDASHLLGLIALREGRFNLAVQLISKARDQRPDMAAYHSDLGLALYASGSPVSAAECFKRSIDINPDSPGAHNNLGNMLKEQGRLDEAIQSYTKAIELRPGFAEAHGNLGIALEEQGQLEKAAGSFKNALDISPDFAKAHYDMGNALRKLGRLDEAVFSFQRAVNIKPDYAEAHNNMGIVLKEQGRLDEAARYCKNALKTRPAFAEAYNNLGLILFEQGETEDAALSYQKALKIKPGFAEAYNNLGNVFKKQGRLSEAVLAYEKALAARPEYAEAFNNLGNVFSELGRLNDAAQAYRAALAARPDFAEAHRHLAMLIKHVEHDADIQAMESLVNAPGTTPAQRMHLCFGLGKAYEDLGRYEDAFGHIREGNRLKRKTCAYDISGERTFFRQMKEVFSRKFLEKQGHAGCSGNTPIFILGMPRSGTSLVEQILASHSQVYGAGELDHMRHVSREACKKITGLDFPECVRELSMADFNMLGRKYLTRVRQHSDTALHITDKMPDNFLYAGLIRLILPEAKIIHCKRDPRDTCLSIFKNYFTGIRNYAYDLCELGEYYLLYQDLMEHWHTVLPDWICDLQYEELVSDPEKQIRKLVEHCGLAWDDSCLSFYKTRRPVHTASAAQVRLPVYTSSIGLWKRYEKQLAPLLSILHM